MKIQSYKITAILTATFFMFGGIPMPDSFAAVNELILNEAQQPVPTITLEQANAQATVMQDAIPSGVAVQNANPLSSPDSDSVQVASLDPIVPQVVDILPEPSLTSAEIQQQTPDSEDLYSSGRYNFGQIQGYGITVSRTSPGIYTYDKVVANSWVGGALTPAFDGNEYDFVTLEARSLTSGSNSVIFEVKNGGSYILRKTVSFQGADWHTLQFFFPKDSAPVNFIAFSNPTNDFQVRGLRFSNTPVFTGTAPVTVVRTSSPLSNTLDYQLSYTLNGVAFQETLLLKEGSNTITRTWVNASGKRASRAFSILVDTVKPTGSININSGAVYALSQTVTLNLSAADSRSGISTMSFSNDGVNWTKPIPYAASKTFTLPAGDGVKRVYVKYYDKAGNVSTVYSKSIILDTLPPAGTVQVNGGVQFINQTVVTLNLSAADAGSGLSKMSFSRNGTTWTTAENYAAAKAWTFSTGDGNKTSYVKFQDKTGKWSAPVSVTVLLDTVKPTGSFGVNSGALYTNSTAVVLNLSAADAASGMSSMSFSTDNVNWTASEVYATSRAFIISAGDGKKTIYVRYYDKAGNVSTVYSQSIILDTIPPAVVLDAATPKLIEEKTLTVNYAVDGVAKTKLFEGLVEGENTLTIIEKDLAGNQTVVNWAVTVETVAWIPATSNANYAFRVIQDSSGYRLELRYNPGGGITVLFSGTGDVPDTFDVTPDGSKVIFEGNGIAYVQRIGEPWTAVTVAGDLKQILYYSDYVMLKTDHTYPSGTVIRTSTGVRISTFNPELISTFYLTLVTPGTGFYRNDSLSLAVQPEYDQTSGQYYALIYRLYGGNDYSSSISSESLGQETPGTAGGTFALVDAVAAPNGETVIAIGLDSSTFNKTFLINQNITFDGAATAATYQNNFAIYTVRDDDGTVRTVRFDLDKLEIVPEIPAIELVQPVITQTPGAANQWTLKLDQAMRGVLYEVQFDAGSGIWQTAGTFVAGNYGEVSWQDPAQDRGPVVYRAVPKEITTAADLLTQINMLYFDTDFGLTEATHDYPLEAWLQRRTTQPSNFGFYANLLATIAAGDLVTSTISKTEAIRRLDAMMTHLLEDQQTLGYKGLLPWLGYYNGDWRRMDDLYGRQVSFEDNTNMTNGLGVAYGALLKASLAGNATVHAQGGILDKIDAFIENQREGYVAMYNSSNQTFARTMVISDGHLEGTVDLFGAESMGTLLFLILQYGDAFPPSAFQKLNFSTRTYAMQDGSTREVVAPFSGAFQMYWPALLMPESTNADLRAMLETYTDVQLDFANRNNQPGLLSASYDVGSYDLLSRYINAFSWQGDSVSTSRGADGSYHLTAGSTNGIGVAFTDDNKYVFEGSTMRIRYASQTAVPNARLEFKQKIDGVLTTVYVQDLALENTGGEVRTLNLTLPENGVLGDLSEVVFVTSDGTGPLDLTFYSVDTDRIAYNFSLGINEIAMNGVSETTPSVYNLGAAHMFRPAEVEALLQTLIEDHPDLITDHGLWEGKNMTTGKVVKEQVFNNVLSFILGMTGTGSSSITRYLENKGLMTELESIWNPQMSVSLTDWSTSGNFEWNGFKGTSWRLSESVRASDRELHIAYQSATTIQGVKLELKHANSTKPAYGVQFDLPATGSTPGEFVLTVPESILYWYIAEAVVLFPETQGFPNTTITGMTLAPLDMDIIPPVVVVDPGTPHLINTKSLTVSYTSDGVAKTKIFNGLAEGNNALTITETDSAGNRTDVNWNVTVDTIAPAVVLDPGTPNLIYETLLKIYYTSDGIAKQKSFTGLTEGLNTLTITETDLAGNQTVVSWIVTVDTTARPYLDISGARAVPYSMTSNAHTGVFSNAGPNLKVGWQASYIENRGFVQFKLADFYSLGIPTSKITKIEFVADYISGSGSISLYDMKAGETGSYSLYSIYFYVTSTLIQDMPAAEYQTGIQADVTSAVLADIAAGKGWSGLMLKAPSYQGYPNVIFSPDAHLRIYYDTPTTDTVSPVVALDAGTPSLIKEKSLTVSYTADGIAKTKVFEGLVEGANTLTITEADLAGNQATVSWNVTVDTIAPVVELDSGTPTMIASPSITVNFTLDGVLKQKTFTNLTAGVNHLTILETDPAGNQASVNFPVNYLLGTDLLRGQIATFSLNGGNADAAWDSGILRVSSTDFKGVGVAAITNDLSINVRQLQISYSSLTPVPNAKIEYKVRDSSGNLIVVKTQYLNLENTGGAVKTVNSDLILSGYPPIDEIVFVTQGTGSSSLDMKFYGLVLF